MHFTSFATLAVVLAPGALAHGYIKEWGVKGQGLEKAQKSDLKSSSFRAVSDNTGWIGSNFLTSGSITCGAKTTPGGTVQQPSGTLFSTAAQSAGRELAVQPGQTVEFVVSGNPGEGWPHRTGIVQTYLGSCGGDCTNFDASQAEFFKIQEEINGIQNTLIPAYDGSVDGNRYDVKIPEDVEAGSYIMRFELIAFGQSSNVEGNQDQYYPFCGQIKVGGGNAKRSLASVQAFRRQASAQTISFPGGYTNGNLKSQSAAPGPNVVDGAVNVSVGSSSSRSNSTSSSGSGKKGAKLSTGSSSSSSSSDGVTLGSSAPQCANMCLRVKISEAASLAASCDADDDQCLCKSANFVKAFENCAKDNCDGEEDAAVSAFKDACAAGAGGKKREVLKGAERKNRRSTRGIGGSAVRHATVKRANGQRMHKTRRAVAAQVVGKKH